MTITDKAVFTGQVARAMADRGLRFGFASTYDETAFLKINTRYKTPQLQYSTVIKHSDVFDENKGDISVRLGILYLLHRVSDRDASTWSFSKNLIRKKEWTAPKPNHDKDILARGYETPDQLRVPATKIPIPAAGVSPLHLGPRHPMYAMNLHDTGSLKKAIEDAESENKFKITVSCIQCGF